VKFSSVLLGKRAEMPVTMEYRGETLSFAVRPLDGNEEALVLERATDFARKRNAATVEPGNPIFDLGVMAHSLAIAAIDIDSPEAARTPYFDGGAESVLGAFGPEEIGFMFSKYEWWQGECSPTIRQMSSAQLVAKLIEIAGSEADPGPFLRLGSVLQWKLLHFSACLALKQLDPRSLSSSPADTLPTSRPS
jgi:hypothetical protein